MLLLARLDFALLLFWMLVIERCLVVGDDIVGGVVGVEGFELGFLVVWWLVGGVWFVMGAVRCVMGV